MKKRLLLSSLLLCACTAFTYSRPSGPATQVPHYDFSVTVVPDAHRLEVTGTLLTPAVNEARASLQIALSNVMRDLQVEILEPKASAGPAKLGKHREVNKMIVWMVTPAGPIAAG